MSLLVGVVLGLLPIGLAALLFLRLTRTIQVRLSDVVIVGGVGAVLGGGAWFVERWVLAATGLALDAATAGPLGALLATFLFAAPFREALLVLPVWQLYSRGRLDSRRLGILFATACAAGFALTDNALTWFVSDRGALFAARLVLSTPAQLFCAGAWGYALGSRGRGRWFTIAWVISTATHGMVDHIVLGRGAGFLAGAAPLLAGMLIFTWLALRDLAPASAPGSRPSLLFVRLPEPPSLRAMQRALRRTDRPLMLHWIAIGALVTLGVVIAAITVAVWTGHRVGIEFAAVDESDVRSGGPLILLGSAVLTAFPFAGYLVARASGASSVLEPAMGAALAIAAVVALLSVTSAVALVLALAVAPVAFALACGGAWFGMER